MPNSIETISYIEGNGVQHPIDAITIGGKTRPDNLSGLPTVSSTT